MGFLLLLLLFWIGVHIANYLSLRSRAESLLPTPRVSTALKPRGFLWQNQTTQVVLKQLHLRIQTSALNGIHDRATKQVSLRHRLRFLLTVVYNLGVVAGVLGTLTSLGFLGWECIRAVVPTAAVPHLHRRDSGDAPNGPHASSMSVTPLIPGVTVPMSHLPAMMATVLLSQVVHELGHACSAALNAIPVLSTGVSLSVVIPAAFVTFPSLALETLSPLARARIIGAGPFHNLVFWIFLLAIDRVKLGAFLTDVAYRDVSDMGRVVFGVDSDSDLRNYLSVGSLILKLDDTSLGSDLDIWSLYLNGQPPVASGWCAASSGDSSACCHDKSSLLSCFVGISSQQQECHDAVSILTSESTPRCQQDGQCADGHHCIRTDKSTNLLRLTLRGPSGDHIVLWNGPAVEIYEQVQIGALLPRFWFLPVGLYTSLALLWQYLKLATLSLFLFNLLPLPYLDGSQFVQALLDHLFVESPAVEEYDIAALESASTSRRGRTGRNWGTMKKGLAKWITRATTTLFVVSAVVSMAQILQ